MNLSQVSLFLLLLCFLITFTAGNNNPTRFTGDVSINCGSTGTFAARDGRQWLGDEQQKPSSLLQLKGLSAASGVIHKLISADPVPHKTARVSRSQFSYTFQVNPGQKIIRLHFNPTQYGGFNGLKDLFTVEAGPFTLLSNFSASITAHALAVNTFAKEFCLNIQENQQLNIDFSPENSQSLDTYAFINGVEIISVPMHLSYFYGRDRGLHVIGQNSLVYVDNSIALEIIHRLCVRKDFVSSADDFNDIFGMWATVPKQELNNINNTAWEISVDMGFRYLVRLHFSKIGFKMAESNGLSFKVLINDIVVKETDDRILPRHEDYVVMINGCKKEGKCSLLICLQSDEEFVDGHGPIKGLEILKLSNPDSSLASPNALPPAQDSPSQTIQTLVSILVHRNAIATVAIIIISSLSIIVHKFRGIWEARITEEENKPSARAERVCRRFSLTEIKLATKNFSDGLLLGRGGFGKVYKGLIDNGQKIVAIKRLKSNSKQGAHEFLTEIETLSELRHDNLVSLIGYCSEHKEMILVYEYMACGTLADHLYNFASSSSNHSTLAWKQLLNICIGAARGLHYLHTGRGVIHRDVKPSNILLDENFVAKVSDFGLAKLEDRSKLQSHVSTKVKGTRGYLDAYYFHTGKLTTRSDIYAFGVVLLEVLCGRPAVDLWAPEDERLLCWWARDKISKGEVDEIVASSLREEISPNSLKTFVEIAERCLKDEPKSRPTMSQVLLQLEFALEQQECKQNLASNEISSVSDNPVQPTMATTDMLNLTLHSNKQINRTHKQSDDSKNFVKQFYIPSYILVADAKAESLPDIPECPVLVFINSRSGGQLGGDLLITYRSILNKNQVFDLEEEAPGSVLQRIFLNLERLKQNGDEFAPKLEKKLKIIVAGGDGTAGWLLGVVSDLKLSQPPPIATVPLGTENNLPFAFGWGKKNPGIDHNSVLSFLDQVQKAKEMIIDSWHILMRMKAPNLNACDPIAPLELPHSLHAFRRVSSTDDLNVENYYTFRGGFWNYFSMGMDAQVSYAIHSEHKLNLDKFKNQLVNQNTYVKLAQGWFFPSLFHPSSRNIAQLCKVKIMKRPGHWQNLDIPPSIRSIVCLNLASFSGGQNPWGTPNFRKRRDRDLTPPFVDDGLLEVVGFKDAWDGLLVLAPSGYGMRLAQVHRIRFEFHKGATDHTYMRIDGEPWKQPLPMDDDTVVIEISHHSQVKVLATHDCRSKSVLDPSSYSVHDVDERDSNEDDETVGEEWRKFGAADSFKIPNEVDISHLS